ncbi:sensor histidine kinase [Bacillus mobilis]|uniref:ATP-binding protein n=1 Tax=Bacillus mobilis TaxID=2026190 RepID=UPI002FDC0468
MEIRLPKRFTRNEMYSFLREVITPDKNPVSNEMVFNFNTLTYIEPSGITMLSNIFEWLNRRGVATFINIDHSRILGGSKCALTYLDDSMFFNRYIDRTITTEPSLRPTTRPLELITYSRSHHWLHEIFIPWLAIQLNTQTSSLDEVEVCISEIFNNINDHSSEQIGCIYAQHYPNINQVKIAISDFGVGIPAAIQSKYQSLTDEEALNEAIKEGFSTQSSPGNRGAGLTNIINAIVQSYKGSIHIHSNAGIMKCTPGDTGFITRSSTASGFYPGTFFEIIFNTDNILENEEEDFEW